MASQVLRRVRPLIVILGLALPLAIPAPPERRPDTGEASRRSPRCRNSSASWRCRVRSWSRRTTRRGSPKTSAARRPSTAARASVRAKASTARSRGASSCGSSRPSTRVPGVGGARRAARQQQRHQLPRPARHDEPRLHADGAGRAAGHERQEAARRRAEQGRPAALADAKSQRVAVGKKRVEVRGPDQQVQDAAGHASTPSSAAKLAKLHDAVTDREGVQVDDGKTTTQNAGGITISLTSSDRRRPRSR